MEIKSLIIANMRHKKGGFISILLLMFIISTVLTSVVSININIDHRWDEAAKNVSVGDFVAILHTTKFTPEMLKKIENNKDVDHVKLSPMVTCQASIKGKNLSSSIFLGQYDPDKEPYCVYNEAENGFIKNPSKLKPGEIYIPIGMKEDFKCKVGDSFEVKYNGKTVKKTIKGFIEEPFVGSQVIGYKLAFLSKEDYDEMVSCATDWKTNSAIKPNMEKANNKGSLYRFTLIRVFQKEDSKITVSQLKKNLNEDTRLVNLSMGTLTADQSKRYTQMYTGIMSGILFSFSFFLFVVILVVVGHSISSSIEMEYVNLGVLKACGFTMRKLRLVFFLQYLAVELVGILLGVLASIPVTGYLGTMFVPITGLLASSRPVMLENAALLFALLVVAGLFVFLKTRKIGKISSVEAISGGRSDIYFSKRGQIPVNGRFLNFSMAYRQLITNRKQYVSVVIIAMLLTFFMMAIGSVKNCMNVDTAVEMFGFLKEDVYVDYQKNDPELVRQVENTIKSITPLDYSFATNNMYYTVNNEELLGETISDPSLFKHLFEGRVPKYDNEIVVTEIVADRLNLHVGDEVSVANGNSTYKMIITGTYQSTSDAGLSFGISFDAYKKHFNSKAAWTWKEYVLKDSSKATAVAKELKKKYGNKIGVSDCSQSAMMDNIMSGVDTLVYLVYAASIIFVLIVALLVCGKVFAKERVDISIYKTLGFTTRRLRLQFALRFFLLALVGGILGCVTSLLFSNMLMNVWFLSITNIKDIISIRLCYISRARHLDFISSIC